MATAELVAKIVGKDDSAQAFDSFAKRADAAYKKAANGSNDYQRSTSNLQKAVEDLYGRVERGGTVSASSVAKVLQQHELLRMEIERTFGSIENAAPEVREHYESIAKVIEKTQKFVHKLTDTVDDQKGALTKAGFEWRGIGGTLEQVAGKHGAVIAKAGMASLAIREIIGAFKDLANAVDPTVWTYWTKHLDDHVTKTRAAKDSLVDYLVVINQVNKADAGEDRSSTVKRLAHLERTLTLAPLAPSQRAEMERQINALRAKLDEIELAAQRVEQRDFKRAPAVYGPPRPPDSELWRSAAITSNRLRKEAAEQAEKDKREAERERAKLETERAKAEAIDRRTEALRYEVQVLQTLDPFHRAEIEYLRDSAAGAREATAELRALSAERAGILRQQKIDAAFGGILDKGRNRVVDLVKVAPGVVDPGQEYRARLEFELSVAEMRGDRAMATEAEIAELRLNRDRRMIEEWRAAYESFADRVAYSLTDLVTTGGANFGEIAGTHMNSLVRAGFDDLFADLFGKPGDPNQLDANNRKQSGGWWYDSQGNALSPAQRTRARKAQMAFDFASVGVAGYGAGRTNQDGSNTSSLISGAISGFTATGGNPIGAIVGAVVGYVASALGKAAARDEYKYAAPRIFNGKATFAGTPQLNREEAAAMIAEIQDTYDGVRNAYVKILLKSSDSIITSIREIDGRFQDRASKNFMKHFGEWINGTLPDEIAGHFRGSLKTVFGKVGIEAKKFDQLWQDFDRLDPKKAAALWGELYDAMSTITESKAFFGRSTVQNIAEERRLMERSTAAAFSDDYFKPILDLGRGLNELVGEDQIHAAAEIARLQKEAADTQKQALRELIKLSDQAREKKENALERYELMGMVDEDGNPLMDKQAEFLRAKANRAMARMMSAQTGADAAKWYDEFLATVDQIVSMGYDINQSTGEAWRKWAMEQVTRAEDYVQNRYGELGETIQTANQEFLAQFQPYLTSFTTVVTEVNNGLGGFRDTIGGTIGRQQQLNEQIDTTTRRLKEFADAIPDDFEQSTRQARAGVA